MYISIYGQWSVETYKYFIFARFLKAHQKRVGAVPNVLDSKKWRKRIIAFKKVLQMHPFSI